MKRTLSVLIVFLLCLSFFAGCDNGSTQNGTSQATNDSTAPSDSATTDSTMPSDSASVEQKYKLEIRDAAAFDILNELNDYYSAGEKVTVQLATITEHYYLFYVNGVEQERDESFADDWMYSTYYTFIMPAEDVVIEIEERGVDIPYPPEETCQDEDHDWQIAGSDNGCWYTSVRYVCSKCNAEQFADGELVLPNHSLTEKTADGKTTFSCARCNASYTVTSEIREFNYAEHLECYKIGDPGVKHESFNNPAVESKITDAIDAIIRAEFELTVEYDIISVSHDKSSNVWCVVFWTLNQFGGDQSVYINGNGLTTYIVYGE